MPNQNESGPRLFEPVSVNRLAAPLPDSVLDRYFAEHPDEVDPRRRTGTTKDGDPLSEGHEPIPGVDA